MRPRCGEQVRGGRLRRASCGGQRMDGQRRAGRPKVVKRITCHGVQGAPPPIPGSCRFHHLDAMGKMPRRGSELSSSYGFLS